MFELLFGIILQKLLSAAQFGTLLAVPVASSAQMDVAASALRLLLPFKAFPRFPRFASTI